MNATTSTGEETAKSCIERVLDAIDAANAQDPNQIEVDGEMHPAELVYGQRMSAMLGELHPDASCALQLAVRAQHIRRWVVPRSDYPMDRKGYLRWRADLKVRHAEMAGEVMAECGCPAAQIERVGVLVRKQGAKRDPEAQAVEDCACLVFLAHYFADFAAKHDDEKLISIVRKTWRKMSEPAHKAAIELELPPRLAAIVEKALSEPA